MSRWITLTEQNLAKYQAGGFVEAYKTAALMDGQLDPIPDTIASTILKIRAAIKSGKYSVDRDESKIPAELENDAIVLIVGVCKPRIADDLTETERTALAAANSLLLRIADGKFAVSLPDDPESAATTTQSTGGAQIVRPAKGTPQRSDYNGL